MKGFGKGLALFFVVLVVATLLQILIGFGGGAPYGIAVSLGCIVAYLAAMRFDAIKPMLGVSIFMCIMAVGNLALGEAGAVFMLIGPVVTLILAIIRIRSK